MSSLRLIEYQPRLNVPLSKDEVDRLRRLGSAITVTPSLEQEGCYDLTPGSWVGVIDLGDRYVEIWPKIPMDRLLFLISYALDRRGWRETVTGLAAAPSLYEAVVLAFAALVRRAIGRGLLHGYRTEDDALQAVRGRIRFDDQLRYRFGRLPPAEVRFDEFTADIEENRMLKAALIRLRQMRLWSERARRELRTLQSAFEPVSLVHYDARALPEITYTRLNEHYEPAVELARLILRSTSYELRRGRHSALAFLVDMNQVFEDFVAVALRDALGLPPHAFPRQVQGRRLYLDEGRRVRLYPDLSWWDGSRCLVVGDVKYKALLGDDVVHADLYQLLAYTIATDVPGGFLIYAAGEATEVDYTAAHLGKVLRVMTLDLAGLPRQILAQVQRIANEVRELARRSGADVPRPMPSAVSAVAR